MRNGQNGRIGSLKKLQRKTIRHIYRDIKLNLTIIGTSYTIPKINAPKKKQKVSGCT